MPTSPDRATGPVAVASIYFEQNILAVVLNDGRELRLNLDQIDWLDWLAKAGEDQRANWSLEPAGFAVYWEDLDDGIEIEHLLSLNPLVSH
jgi:hypothetical protein